MYHSRHIFLWSLCLGLLLPLSGLAQEQENVRSNTAIKNWAYFHKQEKYDLAIDQANKAFDLGEKIGNQQLKAVALNREGRSLLSKKNAVRRNRRLAKERFLASNRFLISDENVALKKNNLKYLVDIAIAEKEPLEAKRLRAELMSIEEGRAIEKERDSLAVKQQQLTHKVDMLVDSQLKSQLLLALEKMRVDSLLFLNLQDSLAMDQQRNQIELQENELRLRESQRNLFLALAGMIGIVAIGSIIRFVQVRQHKRLLETKNQIIETERKKSEKLLLNILPAAVASELILNGKTPARRYKQATVFFSDFKNFTGIAKELTPEQLVSALDFYFKVFDGVVNEFRLEKIKTIGDSYMCVGGLPTENTTNPIDVVTAALRIQEKLTVINEERRKNGEFIFETRIGIHSGSLVAGVVGSIKFAFDIWGDTVNVASRIESCSEVGKVNISGATYELVKDHFDCTARGKLPIKNRGEIEMYFVDRLKPHLAGS